MNDTKLKMGDIEPDTVCYEDNTVAHRQRKDGKPEFTLAELRHLVKCWNNFDVLIEQRDAFEKGLKSMREQRDALLTALVDLVNNHPAQLGLESTKPATLKRAETAIALTKKKK